MPSPKRLFLIDGTALAYRSHFAFMRNPLFNDQGMNTSAVYGFTTAVFRLLDRESPDHFAIVFDSPGPTFRHEMYDQYKATREKMPNDMAAQLPYIDQVVDALGIPRVAMQGYEADDIIGTLAKRAEREGIECFMVSGDKDFMQLVTERVKIYNQFKKGVDVEVLDEEGVEESFGVPPDKVIDVLTLMGDSSDNIPGVQGIGPKTAVKLVKQFGSMEEVLKNADKIKNKRAREGVINFLEQAPASKTLVTIDTDVPLDVDADALTIGDADTDRVLQLFEELGFHSLMDRIQVKGEEKPVTYRTVQTEKEFRRLLDELRRCDEFAFDLETTSLNPLDAEIVGFSFAAQPHVAWYVPAWPEKPILAAKDLFSGGARQLDLILAELKPILEDDRIRKGGQNAKYDILVLRNYDVHVRGLAFDTMVESYLLDPGQRQHNLDFLSVKHLNYQKIPTSDIIGKGKSQISMKEAPIEKVAQYACEDADITMRLHDLLRPQLTERGLDKLYREVELPLLSVLMKMEAQGVRVDLDILSEMSGRLALRADELVTQIHDLAGEEFNVNSPKQLGVVLFEKLELHKQLGIQRVRKTKTGYSTSVQTLEAMRGHPLIDGLLEYRSVAKLKNTYVDALPALVNERTGKIHTSFNQTVAATGRLSSSGPNLQNIPIRTPLGREIRRAFVPEDESKVFLSADYSQIELRVLAHMSGDETLIDTFVNEEDVHRRTASLIFDVPFDEVTPELRNRSKAINFGVIYGMGSQRLARETGITMDEAKAFIESYFDTYPRIREYRDRMIEQVRTEGYVETVLGRRRQIPEIHSRNRGVEVAAERVAVNTPIQGSAADLIKVAMIRLDEGLAKAGSPAAIVLQVHDELLLEVAKEETANVKQLVRECMEGAMELRVPIRVDMGVGSNWLEAH